MSKHVIPVVILMMWLSATVAGQQTPAPAKPEPAAPTPNEQLEGQREIRVPEAPGQPVNIRLDLTIIDYAGTGEPTRRTVTTIAADRRVGYVRTSGRSRAGRTVLLNVDAHPELLPEGKVRMRVRLDYTPVQPAGADEPISSLNQEFTLILEPGKSFLMSEAADPLSNRRMLVEGRVTILK